MANIDMSKFTILLVGIVVSTVLVTGVLIPVISDSMGSGGAYTNTGTEYYTSKDSHTADLIFDYDDVNNTCAITVSCDDTEMFSKTVTSISSEITDKYTDIGEPIVIGFGTEFILYIDWDTSDSKLGISVVHINVDSDKTVTVIQRNDGNVQFMMNEKTITYTLNYQEYSLPDILGFKSTQGEYVYAETPYIENDTIFVAYDYTPDPLEPEWGGYNTACGTIDDFTPFRGENYPNLTNTLTFDTTNIGDVIKVNGLEWVGVDPDDSYEYINSTLTHFFVPIEVGSGSGGMSPTMAAVISLVPFILILGIAMLTINQLIKRE